MELREYLAKLKETGNLAEIEEEVSWNLEAAALTAMSGRVGGPIFWFKNIKGYPEGYSLLGDFLGGIPGDVWRRLKVAAGAPQEVPIEAMIMEMMRKIYMRIKPVVVSTGECKQNILLGKDINLFKFPWPYIHMGDGGRYGTLGVWANHDPVIAWTNWGIYRAQIHTKNAIGVDPSTGHHFEEIYRERYRKPGLVMPATYFMGGDPLILAGGCFSAPAGLWEAELIGGLREAPLELVKCETNDLYVPADAEIVIEGEIRPGDLWDEGPFGEHTGFMQGPRAPRPVFRVTCITYRDDPILPYCVEGVMGNIDHALSAGFAAELWRRLRVYHDWPVRGVWCPSEGPSTITNQWVSVDKGKMEPGFLNKLMCETEIPNANQGRLFVLSSTIDPVNTEDGLEEWSLNVRPGKDIKKGPSDGFAGHWMPYLSEEDQKRGTMSQLCFDCTDKSGLRRVTFETAYSKEVQDWVAQNWQRLAFEEALEIKRRDYALLPAVRALNE